MPCWQRLLADQAVYKLDAAHGRAKHQDPRCCLTSSMSQTLSGPCQPQHSIAVQGCPKNGITCASHHKPLPQGTSPNRARKQASRLSRPPLRPVGNTPAAKANSLRSLGRNALRAQTTSRCLAAVGVSSVRLLFQRPPGSCKVRYTGGNDKVGVNTTVVPVHRDKVGFVQLCRSMMPLIDAGMHLSRQQRSQLQVLEFACTAVRAEAFNPKTLFLVGSKGLNRASLCLAMAAQLGRKVH